MSQRALFALGALASALVAVLVLEVAAVAPSSVDMTIPAPDIVQTRPAAGIAEQRLDRVPSVLARPLFHPDRRPAPLGGSAEALQAAETLPRLTGVVVTPAGRSAIFIPPGGKPTTVAEGSAMGALTVISIAAGEVTLQSADGIRKIRPSYAPRDDRQIDSGPPAGMLPPVNLMPATSSGQGGPAAGVNQQAASSR